MALRLVLVRSWEKGRALRGSSGIARSIGMVGAAARVLVTDFYAAVRGCSSGFRFRIAIERWNALESSRME